MTSVPLTAWLSEDEAEKLDAIAAILEERTGKRKRRVDAVRFMLASGAVKRLLKYGKWK
jgi:hypothetical protein